MNIKAPSRYHCL